jgi:YVTN family beta-propeller protein
MKQFYCSVKLVCALIIISISTISSLKAQAPHISYAAGAKVYPIGTAITPLSPSNSGGAVASPGTIAAVKTFAGNGTAGFADGIDLSTSFNNPIGVAVDANGNVYVADIYNHRIRKITGTGLVTTLAGSGNAGYTDGTGTGADFSFPFCVAVDGNSNVYVADYGNNRIRKITADGVVTTLAGSGAAGSNNGTGTGASFNGPDGVCVDGSGNVYVADANNSLIRKITPAGVVTTLAGNGSGGFLNGTGTGASFNHPTGVCVDGSGNVYVGDTWNHSIRKITAAGVVTTLAGNGTAGNTNGTGSGANFYYPYQVAVDVNGNIYVADNGNNTIRKITSAGVVTTVAGSGAAAFANGLGTSASFNAPRGVAVDATGNLFVADFSNNRIRVIYGGGYYSVPALPTGLNIDNTTGVISGIPAVATAVANYVVIATNASGTYTSAVAVNITTTAPPAITAFAPSTGCSGSTVNITGANFTGATAVSFGGTDAASFTVNSSTSITAVLGNGATGNIRITTPAGIGASASPFGIGSVFTPFAYVPNRNDNTVSVINTSNNSITATIPVGTYPYGVSVNPDGSKVYVTNSGANSVSVINTTTNTVSATISIGSSPNGIVVSSDGSKAYVANRGSNNVSVINTATNTVSATISLSSSPAGLTISPDGTKLYVTYDPS